MLIRELPPLRQSYVVTTPNGRRYRWADDEASPINVPSGVRFSDTMPGGFETFDCTLPRRPSIDYSDLKRYSTITAYDAGGEIVGQYRLERAPAVSGDELAISPSAVGWQAALEDNQTVTLIVIDRDLSRWVGPSRKRQIDRLAIDSPFGGPDTAPDSTTGEPALRLAVSGAIDGPTSGAAEAWYDAGAGNLIGALHLQASEIKNQTGSTWEFSTWASDSDYNDGSTFNALLADQDANSVAFRRDSLTTARRFLLILNRYNSTSVATLDRWRMVKHLAVVGNHGMTLQQVGAGEDGFLASDIVRYAVQQFAPALTVTDESITASTFVIPHAAYNDSTTTGNIVRDVTRYGLEDFAVWEGPTLWCHARGARGKKWLARVGPARLEETGPQGDQLWNSVVVKFQDVSGVTLTVGPVGSGVDSEDAVLTDNDPENPATKAGLTRRALLTMGTGTTASATELGRRFLEEQKLLDRSGRAQIVGHVIDDRGILHPYSRVRAGDYITFVDASDTSYRRIVRTEKDRSTRTCSVDLDAPPDALQALLARLDVSLTALGV